MQTRLVQSLVAAATAAIIFCQISPRIATAKSDAPPPFWCDATLQVLDETFPKPGQPADVTAFHAGRTLLCAGRYAAAVAKLAPAVPAMKARATLDQPYWPEFAQTYFFALMAAGDVARARQFLTMFEGGAQNLKPGGPERAFWGGDYANSLADYVKEDRSVSRGVDDAHSHVLDPHLTYAVAALKAGSVRDAIDEARADADTTSLYDLIRGNLYAEAHEWPVAFTLWMAASNDGPGYALPSYAGADRWNVMALEMMYFDRTHAPAAESPLPETCGSPTDIATVEKLAVQLPGVAGVDPSRIMSAAIVGGDAHVEIESKGQFDAYFKHQGPGVGTWERNLSVPAGVDFPACPNPKFVNVPSGP